jgi:tetratricopeptide (TPR) repeat protein
MYVGRDGPALQHLSEAERLYARLAKDFPAKKEYGRELSWCCFERGWLLAASHNPQVRKPEAAIEPAKRAVELAPQEGKYWAALGMAYYRASRHREAVSALEEAQRLGGQGMASALFLAMTRWQTGDRDRARRDYAAIKGDLEKAAATDEQARQWLAEATALFGPADGKGANDPGGQPPDDDR